MRKILTEDEAWAMYDKARAARLARGPNQSGGDGQPQKEK
jgi:hypothetical protein